MTETTLKHDPNDPQRGSKSANDALKKINVFFFKEKQYFLRTSPPKQRPNDAQTVAISKRHKDVRLASTCAPKSVDMRFENVKERRKVSKFERKTEELKAKTYAAKVTICKTEG